MNDASQPGPLDAQVDALLQRISRDRDQRCAQMRAEADVQARDIVRAGRAEARVNVHAAVVQERVRLAEALRQAEARAELELRQQAQEQTRALLNFLWKDIEGALEARWNDPATREDWVRSALHQAAELLDARSWRIESRTSWSASEQETLQREAFARMSGGNGRARIEWLCVPELEAGLLIRGEKVCLNATVSGLLANRTAIESSFLAGYLATPDTEQRA